MGSAGGRGIALLVLAMIATPVFAQQQRAGERFPIHAFHKNEMGGTLYCNLCHAAVSAGSVALKRPGHEQCSGCHAEDFNHKSPKQILCGQCHKAFPPAGSEDLEPFPRRQGKGEALSGFSHARHVDQKARIDAKTGFRADCTFCHRFEAGGAFVKAPAHEQCAACHSKPGMTPQLTAALRPEGCRGCHAPEETEKAETRTAAGRYMDIRFSHLPHFQAKERFGLQCTTCHYEALRITSLKTLLLPKMLDCVQCHDSARAVRAEFRIGNCGTCHEDRANGSAIPSGHTRNVKPDFHTEAFRREHAAEAAAANAKCPVCHLNVTPSAAAKTQCDSCHQAMRPASHTARWKDDLHGKIAALDRTECATCHTAAYCSDCHNEMPRSHQPLPLFKAGAHAMAAQLNVRSCLTCHTFQNTCSACHINKIAQNRAGRERLAMRSRFDAGYLRVWI